MTARLMPRLVTLAAAIAVQSFTFTACDKKPAEGAPAAAESKGEADKPAGPVASCDQRAMSAGVKGCVEYVGSAWRAAEVKTRCTGEGQSFLTGACPAEGVLVACKLEGGKAVEAIHRFYENPDKAKAFCAQAGGQVL